MLDSCFVGAWVLFPVVLYQMIFAWLKFFVVVVAWMQIVADLVSKLFSSMWLLVFV